MSSSSSSFSGRPLLTSDGINDKNDNTKMNENKIGMTVDQSTLDYDTDMVDDDMNDDDGGGFSSVAVAFTTSSVPSHQSERETTAAGAIPIPPPTTIALPQHLLLFDDDDNNNHHHRSSKAHRVTTTRHDTEEESINTTISSLTYSVVGNNNVDLTTTGSSTHNNTTRPLSVGSSMVSSSHSVSSNIQNLDHTNSSVEGEEGGTKSIGQEPSTLVSSTIQSQQETSSSSVLLSTTMMMEERFQRVLTLEEVSQRRVDPLPLEDEPTQDDMDMLYAKDMYELSPMEREKILQDIHGVVAAVVPTTVVVPPPPSSSLQSPSSTNSPQEDGMTSPPLPPNQQQQQQQQQQQYQEYDPEWVRDKQQRLRTALMEYDTNNGMAPYSMALKEDASYVQSPHDIEIPFLRSTEWDPLLAAQKMVSYFDVKLRLFGRTKLTQRYIKWHDLSKEDQKCLDSGIFQLWPVRDVAGRAIMITIPMCCSSYESIDNLMRAFYYMVMTAIHDVETQRNGIIFIACSVGPNRRVDRQLGWNLHKVRAALPVRTVGMHFCYDDVRIIPMMTVGMLVMGATGRVRVRAHYGTTIDEIVHKLSTFGIPADSALPITKTGEPKVKAHKVWLKNRRHHEEKTDDPFDGENGRTIIVVPGRVDCLLGRGKPIQEHVGNLRYQVLLEHYGPEYEAAEKYEKMKLAQTLIDVIHGYNGRFLKPDGAGWVEVSADVAREKVSHAFRTRRASSATTTKPAVVPDNNNVTIVDSKMGHNTDGRTLPSVPVSSEVAAAGGSSAASRVVSPAGVDSSSTADLSTSKRFTGKKRGSCTGVE